MNPKCPLTPDESGDLDWFFSEQYAADLGDRSPFAAQLEKAKTGQLRCQSSPGFRDVSPSYERLARVSGRVKLMREADENGPHHEGVLGTWHAGFQENAHREKYPDDHKDPALRGRLVYPDEVPDHGHYEAPLKEFGRLGLVMWKLSGTSAKAVNDLAKTARSRKLKGHVAAVAKIEALRGKAVAAIEAAWAAYAATRAPAKASPERDARRADERRAKDAERRDHFAGRVDENRAVVFEGPRRRAG